LQTTPISLLWGQFESALPSNSSRALSGQKA
jgi:hypothetical protein